MRPTMVGQVRNSAVFFGKMSDLLGLRTDKCLGGFQLDIVPEKRVANVVAQVFEFGERHDLGCFLPHSLAPR